MSVVTEQRLDRPISAATGRNEALLVAVMAVVTAALGFYDLGDKSFWLDEGYSVSFAQTPWPRFWGIVSHYQVNANLYYTLLHFWTALGESEFFIRTLSVIPVVATVPVLYALTRRLFGVKEAALASILFALNAFVMQFAQEARGYSLALFGVTASTYLLVRTVEDPARRHWIAYGVVGALTVYAHLFALFVVGVHVLSVLLLRPRDTRLKSLVSRRHLRDLLANRDLPFATLLKSYVLMGVLLVPQGVFILFGPHGQINWIPRPILLPSSTTPSLVGTFQDLAGGAGAGLQLGLLAVYALIGFAAIKRIRLAVRANDEPLARWRNALVPAWLFLPVVGTFVLSFVKPIFLSRFLIVSVPALVILTAVGLAALRRWLFAVALVAVVALSARGLFYWYETYKKEDWRGATRHVLARSKPGDGIVFVPSRVRKPFQVYVDAFDAFSRTPEPIDPPQSWASYDGLTRESARELPYYIEHTSAAQRRRVWVILSHGDREERTAALEEMSEDYRLVGSKVYEATEHVTSRIGTGLEIRLYRLGAG